MSTPGDPTRPEGPTTGPYGGYGGALQHYGSADPRSPLTPGHGGLAATPPPSYRPASGPSYGAGQGPAQPRAAAYSPSASPSISPQRPAGVATASTLAITASLLFACGLGLLWLVAFSVTASFDVAQDDQAVIFHLAERFQLRLTQGLAVPLFGFPLLATVTGFLVLVQRSWARLLFTAAGVLALGWSAWWLRYGLGWWVPGFVYVAVACSVVWTRSASHWYAAGDRAPRQAS